jgi:regulator of replication initiation timing
VKTNDLNIEALIDFSNQQDDLIIGHQKEMQQVLRNNEQLRAALALEHAQKLTTEAENSELKKQIEQLQEEKAQLIAENKELKERPNIVAEHYIEKQTIGKQIHVSFPATPRSARRKLNTNDQTQLPLWNNAALT